MTTSATEGSDEAEVNTLTHEFAEESEALGYLRRMADEMLGLAAQLALDFDYSNVGLYEGDVIDEDLDPTHAAFFGAWVLDEDGASFVAAAVIREGEADAGSACGLRVVLRPPRNPAGAPRL